MIEREDAARITEGEVGNRSVKRDEVIKAVENEDIWEEVERRVNFIINYSYGNIRTTRLALGARGVVRAARISGNGYTDIEAANVLGVSRYMVRNSRFMVERVIDGIKREDEEAKGNVGPTELSKFEKRMLFLDKTFGGAFEVISEEIEEKSEFGLLAKSNPHWVRVMEKLAKGNSLGSLVENNELGRFRPRSMKQKTKCLVDYLGGRGEITAPLHLVSRCLLFAQARRELVDLNERDIVSKINTHFLTILEKYGDLGRMWNYYRSFLNLLPVIDYLYEGARIKNGDELQECYPGINFVNRSPYSIDVRAYFDLQNRHDVLPHGLEIVLDAYISGSGWGEIYQKLSEQGSSYSRSGLEHILVMGCRLVENILLREGRKSREERVITDLERSRWNEIRKLHVDLREKMLSKRG